MLLSTICAQLLATDYYNYGQSGLILRRALAPEHRESHQGLFKCFHAGERLDVSGLVAMPAQARQAPSAADRAGQDGAKKLEQLQALGFLSQEDHQDHQRVIQASRDLAAQQLATLRTEPRDGLEYPRG